MTILIIFSIVLNVVALFCIAILYLRQNRLLEVEKKQEKLIKEMEEVISSYLMEMTEENERFINKVREMTAKPTTSNEPIREALKKEDVKLERTSPRKGNVYQAVQAYKKTPSSNETINQEEELEHKTPPAPQEPVNQENDNNSTDLYSQSFYYQALLLKKQGLSIEDIARRLNKGKTEIELLFKLRQNDQE
ncbi:hypothetical protein [Robertmurraya kyonggiensis]|uniref:Coupling factor for flagellin transcription and translation n=1 Tax=Robertmurraya kyonggiensis TaxID=1037680 RepID=A0A4U1D822_9BACI|nr:hypothetical protein [Robertmurraya kyonggiensis]TKC18682.1 hypothetical protein FA727_03775 [Robertmurraya kyonggiensis]